MGHTNRRPYKGGIGQGNKTKNLNEVDDAHCTGMNIEILNWPGPPWEAD
jgi:hypothetical protein